MTRKDYILIATAIREAKEAERLSFGSPPIEELIPHFLALALRTDNPNFDREKFLAACE